MKALLFANGGGVMGSVSENRTEHLEFHSTCHLQIEDGEVRQVSPSIDIHSHHHTLRAHLLLLLCCDNHDPGAG
jgi:hypothetical protein